MRILILSPDFPENTRRSFKLFGHSSKIIRDVPAAINALEHKYVPELAILDNRLDGVDYLLKDLRSDNPELEIYLVVDNEAMENESPDRMGLNGYIVGELTLEKIFSITGDVFPPPAEEEPVIVLPPPAVEEPVIVLPPPAVEPTIVPTQPSVEEPVIVLPPPPKTIVSSEYKPQLVAPVITSPAETPSPEKRGMVYRLAFPAVIGLLAIGLIFNGIGYLKKSPTTEKVLQNFYGTSKDQAVKICEAGHLSYELIYAKSDEPHDFVISQYPPAGTSLDEVGLVTITISNNPDQDASTGPNVQDGQGGGDQSLKTTPSSETAPTDAPSPAPPLPPAPAASPAPTTKKTGSKPTVSVSASRTSGPSSGFIVTFSASASCPGGGAIVSYSWSCGGSGPKTSCEMVSNTAPASRTVTCTVTNDQGQSASASVTITMN